jgi:hypothetical protein
MGYQSHTYKIKNNDCTIVSDTTSILSRWEQFYNLCNVNQNTSREESEICTAQPDIPE